MVDNSVKMLTQPAAAVKKASSMPGIIKKGVEKKTANIALPLHKAMVRAPLEYCIEY